MKRLTLSIFLVTILILHTGCKTGINQRHVYETPVAIKSNDSISTVFVERTRIDTVTVRIPLPRESTALVTRDSTSFIETSVAESSAWINPDGSLGHIIKNKEAAPSTDVFIPVKDSHNKEIVYKYREKPVPYKVTEWVEKELSPWQKFRLDAFWILSAALLIAFVMFLRRFIF